MAFTSLSQALDLDPKEMSCEIFFLHVALYFLCSVWPEVFFFSAYFDTLDLGFLCANNLLHPSSNGNRAVLGAVLGSSMARGWAAQQGLLLPGPGVVCQQYWGTETGSQFLSWTPWGGFAVAHTITSGLRFLLLSHLASCLWPQICSVVCKGESNEGSYWWAVFLANDCAVFAHSSKDIQSFSVFYVLQSTSVLQLFWKKPIFCFN